MLLGLVAATDEPMAGGRHKVFGHHDLAVIPQTSTIASHLPRALGVAFSIDRARTPRGALGVAGRRIAVCSFGDASANHSTADRGHQHRRRTSLTSTCRSHSCSCARTTASASACAPRRAGSGRLRATAPTCAGSRPTVSISAAASRPPSPAAEWVRTERAPAFLHLRTVRFMAHAGTDVEAAYRTPAEIRDDYARDPILGTARLMAEAGVATPRALHHYERIRAEVLALAHECATHPS